jgi:hypothetical protein
MRLSLSVFYLVLAGVSQAATTVELTVSAGKHNRVNEPVRVPLSVDAKVTPSAPVAIKDAKGKVIAAGQLTAPDLVSEAVKAPEGKRRLDLCFVLPALEAGASLALRAEIGDGPREGPKGGFSWHQDSKTADEWTELRYGSRPVLRYMHAALDESSKAARERTFKVFHHVYDPKGERLVTNGAGGKYPHHRGLFYGFMKTSYDKHTVDIWHCRGQTHQAHRAFRAVEAGPVLGRHLIEVDWNGVGKATFARELRELSAWNVPGGTLIDFCSRLTPTGPDVKLDGDPQHAGFHFRAANEVAEKDDAAEKKKGEKETIFIRPDGADKPGATRNWDGKRNTSHVNLSWLAMCFVLDGKRYTAAYLDRPDNPKEARYSERSYGRFGSYFVTTATKEKPLLVRYRVWLQEGQMKPEEVKALDEAFVEPVEVKAK